MAELTTKNETETEASIPGLLPHAEVQEKAEAIRRRRELPKPPGKGCTFRELTQWLGILTPEMEQRIMIYVYRHRPIIIRQKVDPSAPNNIDVISDGLKTLDEKYFIDRHGGGIYGLTVVDSDRGKVTGTGFFEVKLEIPMAQYPPKLDLREVDWAEDKNKGYKSWARAMKLIDENDTPMTEVIKQQQQQNPSNDTASTLKLMLDFADRMSERDRAAFKSKLSEGEGLGKAVGELMLENMKQNDPNKQVTTLASLMQSMKPSGDTGIAAIIPMFTAVLNTMMESSKANMVMLVEVMKANKPEPAAEGKDEVERLRSLIEVARELRGGNPSKGTAEVIMDKLADIIPPVLNIAANIMAIKARQAGVLVETVTTTPETPSTRANQLIQQNVVNGKPEVANQDMNILKQFAPLILTNMSKEGWEFAAWIAEGYGDMIATMVTRQGPENLLVGMKAIPELWEQVERTYGEEYATTWVKSFCDYKEIIAKLDAEEEK